MTSVTLTQDTGASRVSFAIVVCEFLTVTCSHMERYCIGTVPAFQSSADLDLSPPGIPGVALIRYETPRKCWGTCFITNTDQSLETHRYCTKGWTTELFAPMKTASLLSVLQPPSPCFVLVHTERHLPADYKVVKKFYDKLFNMNVGPPYTHSKTVWD